MKKQEDDVNLNPPWLGSILKAHFFEPCKAHKHIVTTQFCTNCLGDSHCISCMAEDYDHQHAKHNLISACTYSNYTVIRKVSIGESIALAFSDIQIYDLDVSSNSESIFLVNQLPQKKRESLSSFKVASRCMICRQGLSDRSFKFCSIECKAKNIDGHMEPKVMISRTVHPSICGLRKRRASPQRTSPLL